MIIFLDDRTVPEMMVLVNAEKDQMTATITILSNIWDEHFPHYAFQYELLEDRLDRIYSDEEVFRELLTVLSSITIFITILGVVGLISFTTELKRKEIAIRKVNGAQVESILIFLSKQFLVLLSIAFLIAGPVGYYFSRNWLENYAIHTEWQMGTLGLTFTICLVFTIMAILYQALKAANANPVLALRDE